MGVSFAGTGLHKALVKRNPLIEAEYNNYIRINTKGNKRNRVLEWIYLMRLNIAYTILNRKGIPEDIPAIKEASSVGKNYEKQTSHYDYVRGLWQFGDNAEEIIEYVDHYAKNNEAWYHETNLLWLIYISCLFETDKKSAVEVLNTYIKHFGLKDVYKFVNVSFLADENHISNGDIRKTLAIWNNLNNNRAKERFNQYIKDKKIAIVGNSGVEIGTSNGAAIDSHDIVIRFNNFHVEGYEQDYGKKTSVWMRSGNNEVADSKIDEFDYVAYEFDYVVYEFDYVHTMLNKNVIDIISRHTAYDPQKLFYMDSTIKNSIRNRFGIANPTSGFLFFYYLYTVLGTCKNIDLYGFSFKTGNRDKKHYYDNLCRIGDYHDMDAEMRAIDLLYKESGAPSPVPQRFINEPFKQTVLFNMAYRVYDEKRGLIGGPGGVLHMQETLFGDKYRGVNMDYLYCPETQDNRMVSFAKVRLPKLQSIAIAAAYVMNHPGVTNAIANNENAAAICHDMGMAYGCYLMKIPYVLIYHQQGSLCCEVEAVGAFLTENEEKYLRFIEETVFLNAETVFFPSNGARDKLIETSLLDKENIEKIRFGEVPLYNTLIENEKTMDLEQALESLGLQEIGNTDAKIFMSISDYNVSKGIDRIPVFLNRYVEITGEKVIWILIGGANNKEMYESMLRESTNWKFKSFLFGKRVDHSVILSMLDYSDYYIMLHRKSIFDLSTLEAMRAGNAVILSSEPANKEFNVNDNVVIVDMDRIDDAISNIRNKDLNNWKQSNKEAYNKHFSNSSFYIRYAHMIDDFVGEQADKREHSEVNAQELAPWRDKYKGQKVVICGGGTSLEQLRNPSADCKYIALNHALFYDKIHFDFLFMQDYPKNHVQSFEDYNSYDCTKFYGICTNKNIAVEGISLDETYDDVVGKVVRYELAPHVFIHDRDIIVKDIDKYYLVDAQSVLFSAIQFAIFAGFSDIELYGIDFSDMNYGNESNKAKYARNVTENLISFKKQTLINFPGVNLHFGATTNEALRSRFHEVEREYSLSELKGI